MGNNWPQRKFPPLSQVRVHIVSVYLAKEKQKFAEPANRRYRRGALNLGVNSGQIENSRDQLASNLSSCVYPARWPSRHRSLVPQETELSWCTVKYKSTKPRASLFLQTVHFRYLHVRLVETSVWSVQCTPVLLNQTTHSGKGVKVAISKVMYSSNEITNLRRTMRTIVRNNCARSLQQLTVIPLQRLSLNIHKQIPECLTNCNKNRIAKYLQVYRSYLLQFRGCWSEYSRKVVQLDDCFEKWTRRWGESERRTKLSVSLC